MEIPTILSSFGGEGCADSTISRVEGTNLSELFEESSANIPTRNIEVGAAADCHLGGRLRVEDE